MTARQTASPRGKRAETGSTARGAATRERIVRNWPLIALLAAYVGLALAYSLAAPIYEPTDEIRHFRYVRHLIVYRDLPVQQAEGSRAQSHHPPLYYALSALVSSWVPVSQDVYYEPPTNPYWGYRYWEVSDDNKNQYLHGDEGGLLAGGVQLAVYVVRWFTILLGAVAVWLTYRSGLLVTGGSVALSAGAAALLALNPQFLHLSGAVNNDIAATLWGAAGLYLALSVVREGPNLRRDVMIGLVIGLALLTKLNLAALIAPTVFAYLLGARSRDGCLFNWRSFLRGAVIIGGLSAILAGWWFWRNQVLYGDATSLSKVSELWSGREPAESWWALRQSLPYLWSSLWGRFGYGQVPMPQGAYMAALGFCVVALAGHMLPRRERAGRPVLLLLTAFCVAFVAVVAYYILIQPAGAMGRFLFPALPAFALLLILGMRRFVRKGRDWLAGLVAVVVLAGLAVYALAAILQPAFARPQPLKQSAVASVPNRVDAKLSGVATILGYEVSPAAVRVGEVVNVTVFWQANLRTDRDHSVFVHFLSDEGTIIAQRDTYPGLGRCPTTAWEPGVAFADVYRVHVPETAFAPDSGYIQVGMYLPGGPRLTTPDGRDAVRLTSVRVIEKAGSIPNPMQYSFAGQVALVGYTIDRRVVRPGESLRLTLYWQALSQMEVDYSVFAHVLGAENQVWARSDGWPAAGASPTSSWSPGETIEDVRELTIDPGTPPYLYDVEVGLYVPGASPLPVVAEDGHWLAQRVLLSQVRVADE